MRKIHFKLWKKKCKFDFFYLRYFPYIDLQDTFVKCPRLSYAETTFNLTVTNSHRLLLSLQTDRSIGLRSGRISKTQPFKSSSNRHHRFKNCCPSIESRSCTKISMAPKKLHTFNQHNLVLLISKTERYCKRFPADEPKAYASTNSTC